MSITTTVLLATDDPVLVQMALGHVLHVPRPLALEDGPLEKVIAHALTDVAADLVVVLQPSSPSAKRKLYVRAALDRLERTDASSVISVVPWVGEPPQKAVFLANGKLHIPPALRRQDAAPAYRRDGTVYAVRGEYARKGDLYGPHPVPLLVTPADSVTVD